MKKQLIAMGLATVLTVPSWIMAAHPLDASAKQATVSKKAKAVITKIKAISNKKSNYIKTTLAARTAYNKLSKTDKKRVSNYKTLQKHVKVVTPLIAKVNKIKKDANALTNGNYKTRAAKVSSAYNALNTAGKAYVPASTVRKITSYSNLNAANTGMRKLVSLSSTTNDFVTAVEAKDLKDGAAIMKFITAYEKLTDNQKRILGGSQEAIDILLQLKPVIKEAVDYDAKYNKLIQGNSSYLKQAYELMGSYVTDKGGEESITVTYGTPATSITLPVSNYTKNHAVIMALPTKLAPAISVKEKFEAEVDKLPGDLSIALVNNAIAENKKAMLSVKDASSKILGKPIDIVDKKALAEYKKYESIPTVITTLKAVEDYDSQTTAVVPATFTADEETAIKSKGLIKSQKDLTALDKAMSEYAKLGVDQKQIIEKAFENETTKKNQAKYANDASILKKGQTMSKAFIDALNKNDLSIMKKQFDAYKELAANDDRTIRYVVQAPAIQAVPTKYKPQFDHITDFETKMDTYTDIAGLKGAIAAYTVIQKDKPSGLKLIDPAVLKEYELSKTVVEIEKLKPVARPTSTTRFTTKQLNTILTASKLYNKLSDVNKDIVDKAFPDLMDYAREDKEIKEAMAIDKKFLALKPSKKSYNKDAKLVYSGLQDANLIVEPYVVYAEKIKILNGVYAVSQKNVDDFEVLVNEVYEEMKHNVTTQETISNIKMVKNLYEHKIMPYTKATDLLDPVVLKRYDELTPILDVFNRVFMLKKNPSTIVERDDILAAIKAYEKLTPLGKQFIQLDNDLIANRPLLNDKEIIEKAKKIDAKYASLANKTPLDKFGIYSAYLDYEQSAEDVKKYVMTSKQLIEAKEKYKDLIEFANEFTKTVEKMNSNNKLVDIQILRGQYNDAKRENSDVDQFISQATFKKYDLLLETLSVQSAAKFISTTKKGEDFETWLYKFNNVENGVSMNTIRNALLLFSTFNSVQHAILRNSPEATGEQRELNFNYSEWANQTQIGHLTDAIKLEKKYLALKPTTKTYARDVIKIVDELSAGGKPIQKFFLYNVELKKLENTYRQPIANADAFEKAVRDYVLTSGIAGMKPMKDAYAKFELDPIALANTDPSLVKKYLEYILADEVNALFAELLPETPLAKTMENNENLVAFISKFNRLTTDAKTIFKSANSAKVPWIDTLVKEEKEIKAAQAVDKKYLALDKTSPTYEAEVLKVYTEYMKLTDNAKTKYFVNKTALDTLYASYADPTKVAQEFIDMVALLNADSPYTTQAIVPPATMAESIEEASVLYKKLATAQTYGTDPKKVIGLNFVDNKTITKYKQYEPLVTIKENLDKVKDRYKPYTSTTKFTLNQRTAITEAIALHKKLGKEQRYLFDHDNAFGEFVETTPDPENQLRYLMLVEADIKAAIAVDDKFKKIKKGDKAFVKNVIDAMASYNNLVNFSIQGNVLKPDKFPQRFFTETALYNTYNSQYKTVTIFDGPVNSIPEAILAITNFEQKIKETQTRHDYINQSDPVVTITPADYKAALDAIVKADEYYDFLNRDFMIEGEKIRLTSLVESKYLTQYTTFMKIYDVNEYLKGLN